MYDGAFGTQHVNMGQSIHQLHHLRQPNAACFTNDAGAAIPEKALFAESVSHCDRLRPKNLRTRNLTSNEARCSIYTLKSQAKLAIATPTGVNPSAWPNFPRSILEGAPLMQKLSKGAAEGTSCGAGHGNRGLVARISLQTTAV